MSIDKSSVTRRRIAARTVVRCHSTPVPMSPDPAPSPLILPYVCVYVISTAFIYVSYRDTYVEFQTRIFLSNNEGSNVTREVFRYCIRGTSATYRDPIDGPF